MTAIRHLAIAPPFEEAKTSLSMLSSMRYVVVTMLLLDQPPTMLVILVLSKRIHQADVIPMLKITLDSWPKGGSSLVTKEHPIADQPRTTMPLSTVEVAPRAACLAALWLVIVIVKVSEAQRMKVSQQQQQL
jgi:hypothetical protein